MKTRYKLLTICCSMLAVMLCSCQDFLTESSKSSLTTDNFYQKPADMDQALTGVYGTLKPLPTYYFIMSESRSDNMFQILVSKQNEYADCAHFNTTGLLNDNIVNNCWSDLFSVVAAANAYLDNIDNVTFQSDEIKEQYEGEGRFLRALAYFDLVRFFGRVPVTTHVLSTSESFSLSQSEAIDIYNEVIVPDLQRAVETLHDTPIDYNGSARSTGTGHVTLAAAKGLLGKVYMQMAGYPLYQDTKSKAQQLFKEVLDYASANNKYWVSSMSDWNKMWIHENDNKYFMFEIQYVAEANQGNPATPLCRPSTTSKDEYCNAYLTAGQHVYVERDLQEHFFANSTTEQGEDTTIVYDERFKGTINSYGSYDEETGTYSSSSGNNIMVKFFEHKMKRADLGYSDMDAEIVDRRYWPQNWPILRIEDIALLYAECVGNTTEGYYYLNKIRNRAGLTSLQNVTPDEFQEAVKQERRYELLGEGHRWFDEVRQNTFVNDCKTKFINYRDNRDSAHSDNYTIYANRVTQNMALYPIPLAQIQVREGLYEQNPGY